VSFFKCRSRRVKITGLPVPFLRERFRTPGCPDVYWIPAERVPGQVAKNYQQAADQGSKPRTTTPPLRTFGKRQRSVLFCQDSSFTLSWSVIQFAFPYLSSHSSENDCFRSGGNSCGSSPNKSNQVILAIRPDMVPCRKNSPRLLEYPPIVGGPWFRLLAWWPNRAPRVIFGIVEATKVIPSECGRQPGLVRSRFLLISAGPSKPFW